MYSSDVNHGDKIDFVFLWCDGSDPKFIAQKNQRAKEFNIDLSVNNHSGRYVEHDELRYALRSVYTYAPWFNHIYIVTNNQRPSWLVGHPRVTVVDHKDIIPEELLPTFSSICIEMYLDRIPGLSEKFIYGNDDMFLNRPINPSDFFTKEGKPFVWLSKGRENKVTADNCEAIMADKSVGTHMHSVIRAWRLYQKVSGNKVRYRSSAHSFDAYTKTIFGNVVNRYPEILKANAAPFRTEDNISRVLFSYEMAYSLDCPIIYKCTTTALSRLIHKYLRIDTPVVVGYEFKRFKRDLAAINPQTFCLNQIIDNDVSEVISFLDEKYPNQSPWEIQNTAIAN